MNYLITSLIILILGFLGLLAPFSSSIVTVVAPVQFGLRKSAIDIKSVLNFYSNVNKVRDENVGLLNRNFELEQELSTLKLIRSENEMLKQQLGIALTDQHFNYVTQANIVGNLASQSVTNLFINKGSRDKVQVNDIVVVGSSLVGVIRTVEYSRSVVELISSSGITFSVIDIDSPQKVEGLAVGRHGSTILVEKILQKEEIKAGDTVVTSGKDGTFPPDLLVGKIVEISADPSQPLKSAQVASLLNFSRISRVFVVRVN